MTAKQIYTAVGKSLFIGLFTSYIVRGFIIWNWNAATWTEGDRVIFLFCYFFIAAISCLISLGVQDAENERLKEEKRRQDYEERQRELDRLSRVTGYDLK